MRTNANSLNRRLTAATVLVTCVACDFGAAYQTYSANYALLDGGDDDAGVQCAPSSETNPCFKCTDEKCCGPSDSCHADARCTNFYQQCLPTCMSDGGTYDACILHCHGIDGAGHAEYAPYFACTELNCLTECAPPSPCVSCLVAQCPDAVRTCDSDSECAAMTACWNLCNGNNTCQQTCRGQYSSVSVMRFDTRNGCAIGACAAACN